MRKLATIRVIQSVEPIQGKDRVELAHVDGWTCMVSKADGFKAGSKCIFCEPDSVFPAIEQWAFLAKYKYRIKTQKFKDSLGVAVYSQGLVLPLTALKGYVKEHDDLFKVGDDVTKALGITQYEETMDKEPQTKKPKYYNFLMRFAIFRKLLLPKKVLGKFPDFIKKTDEERIQNCPNILKTDTVWTATEKVDGQSGTFAVVRHRRLFKDKYEFIVCSRNFRLNRPDNSSYWSVAKKYDIKNKLIELMNGDVKCDWVAIQGECIAPNVQKNKYKVKEADLYVFNLIYPEGRVSSLLGKQVIEDLGMKWVPIVCANIRIDNMSVEDILEYATGESKLVKGLREGIVFRSGDGKLSFKAVSPEFLIKHGE